MKIHSHLCFALIAPETSGFVMTGGKDPLLPYGSRVIPPEQCLLTAN